MKKNTNSRSSQQKWGDLNCLSVTDTQEALAKADLTATPDQLEELVGCINIHIGMSGSHRARFKNRLTPVELIEELETIRKASKTLISAIKIPDVGSSLGRTWDRLEGNPPSFATEEYMRLEYPDLSEAYLDAEVAHGIQIPISAVTASLNNIVDLLRCLEHLATRAQPEVQKQEVKRGPDEWRHYLAVALAERYREISGRETTTTTNGPW